MSCSLIYREFDALIGERFAASFYETLDELIAALSPKEVCAWVVSFLDVSPQDGNGSALSRPGGA
jgi:hypothetical protein